MILNIKKISILAMAMASLAACDLDVIPPSDIAAESIWKTDKDAWYGLNACYAQLPGMDIWDEMCTDNAHSQKPWEGNFEVMQMDGISASSFNFYDYSTIRIVNNFLEKVDLCNMDEGLRKRMKAEARFFRAFSYLDLTTKYGKVPLVTDLMEYDAPNVPRDSKETIQAFVLQELSEIAEILPQRDQYDGSNMKEKGRISRGAALALRARAALYFGNFAEAEASAGKVISEGKYSLFRIGELNAAQKKEAEEMETYIDFDVKGINKDKFMKGLFSYECLWHDAYAKPENPEYVLTHEYMADDNNNDWTRYIYIRPSQLVRGYTSFAPMQDLVDAYWEIDGKTIPDPIPATTRSANLGQMYKTVIGKDKEGKDITIASADQGTFIKNVPHLDLKNSAYMQEFRNRDSRLYASILFPFKGWFETDFPGDFYYRFFPDRCGGNDTNESWTGYNYRKLVSLTPYDDYNSQEDYPVIRYAEVLLTYAEARIQNQGWDTEVKNALNDLRDRCGMPNVPEAMGSKQEALDFVRNERRIELAAEGHRFDDMRRYGNEYCAKVMNGPTYAPAGYDKEKQEYIPYVLVDKKWSERLLLMPLPQSAIDTNPLLKDDQNPGY